MKKKILIIFMSALMLLTVACGRRSEPQTVRISSRDWCGDYEDYIPETAEKTYTVSVGDTIDLSDVDQWYDLKIKIKAISDDGITIVTSEPLNETDEKGQIPFDVGQNKFVIEKNKELTLITPTMDAGVYFTFEWIPEEKGE